MNSSIATGVSITPGWPLKSLTPLSKEELKSDFYKFQGRGLTSTYAMGEPGEEQKMKWEKERGDFFFFF